MDELRCPACGHVGGSVYVVTEIAFDCRMNIEIGSDPDIQGDETVICGSCGHEGKADEFGIQGGPD